MPASQSGQPTNFLATNLGIDIDTSESPGGMVNIETANETLLYGDLLYYHPGGRVGKQIESSLNMARFAGVCIGGSGSSYAAVYDSGQIGLTMALVGERVLVHVLGYCYLSADATGILNGQAISAGRTTAGRVRGDLLYSAALNDAGLAIKAGASTLVKAVNVVQTIVAGVPGTSTAANLDMAALSGTVLTGTYNVFVFRVGANGTTVTSAMGTAASTLAGVVWPTGSITVPALGAVIIHPTGVGSFVGGTTALDDATVIPNATYLNFVRGRAQLGYARADGGAAGTSVLAWINAL